MKSKLDLFNILSKEGQIYLPPYEYCTMDFLKQILSGNKRYLKNEEISIVNVPRFSELAGKRIYERIRGISFFMNYLPSENNQNRPLPR
jgi:hypothetical protein